MSNIHRATLRASLRFGAGYSPCIPRVVIETPAMYAVLSDSLLEGGRSVVGLRIYFNHIQPIPTAGGQCIWRHTGFDIGNRDIVEELERILSFRHECSRDFITRYHRHE